MKTQDYKLIPRNDAKTVLIPGFLKGDFGKDVDKEVQGKYGKFSVINKIGYNIRTYGWIMIILSIISLCIFYQFYGNIDNLTELFEYLLLGIMLILGSIIAAIGRILQKN